MDPINLWFNSNEYGASPHEICKQISDFFYSDVKSSGMEMCVSSQYFYKLVCEAMCVMYDQNLHNEFIHVKITNTSHFEYPPGWNQEIESIWIDFLNTHVFGEDYWERFWGHFKTYEWESEVFPWRSEMQTLLPYYVTRSMTKLIHESIIDNPDEDAHSETVSDNDSDNGYHSK